MNHYQRSGNEVRVFSMSLPLPRRKQGSGTTASMAANLPTSVVDSRNNMKLPPVVTSRLTDTILQLCRIAPRVSLHIIVTALWGDKSSPEASTAGFEKLLDLLQKPTCLKAWQTNLD
jgi:hypothetical protein